MILTTIKCIVQHFKYIPLLCCHHHPFPELIHLPKLEPCTPYSLSPSCANNHSPSCLYKCSLLYIPHVTGVLQFALLRLTSYIGKHFQFYTSFC